MNYQGKAIELLQTRSTFGKEIASIRILTTGQIIDVPLSALKETTEELSLPELAFKAMAARIRNEMNSQSLFSPYESNIVPLPHQILALEKVISGSYLRFLMADEVGMGKTIETGLILKELKLRGILKRALIIVPVSAMKQWQKELKLHFNESFHIYDSRYISTLSRTFNKLEADNEVNIWSRHNQIIVSMDALKPLETRQGWSEEKVEQYNRSRILNVLDVDFDLLVIDECHKVGGSTNLVSRFKMAETLCNAIPNVLLLSATPHRGKSDHFRRVLSLLDADAFSGEGMPSIDELTPYVVRTEKRQAIDYTGKPLFNKRITERQVVPYSEVRHIRQKALYEEITNYVVHGYNLSAATKNTSYGFVMVLFQRMMSSSTQAILDAMERRVTRLSEEHSDLQQEQEDLDFLSLGYEVQLTEEFESRISVVMDHSLQAYETELELLKGLVRQGKECVAHEIDAKLEYLIDRLNALKQQEDNLELKFLIFTEFTSTQKMLKKELEQRGGFLCEVVNGSMDFEIRVEALKTFKEKAQILISTDAAGESLNMQFAHIIINYDMPWNPMIIEQRIGRVDRIGQKHKVLAINIMLDNSIDQRVYEVIETKLNNIIDELGIDKTSDVLDSTLENEGVNNLFLTSLLDPDRFESESDQWLQIIKNKLKDYMSTEGVLPKLEDGKIDTEKAKNVHFSPLPAWLEILVQNYLESKHLPYRKENNNFIGSFPGYKECIYTFNTKEGLENPIPEPLTLQHEIILSVMADAVPFIKGNTIPHITLEKTPPGYWTLWSLLGSNAFEKREKIIPLYFTDDGDTFTSFGREIWSSLSSGEMITQVSTFAHKSPSDVYEQIHEKGEKALEETYKEIENDIKKNIKRIEKNKKKAFEFRERQIKKLGIENIRKARMNKLIKEKEEWILNFESASQVIPNLKCLLLVRVSDA